MARLLPHRLLALLAIVVSLLPMAASAQNSTTTAYINDILGPQEINTAAGLPALTYEVDLTLLNPAQDVVNSVGVVSATMALKRNGPSPAQVQKLDAPWTMVVLIDASSTLAPFSALNDYKSLRTQLGAAMSSLPDGYNVSVEKFDTQPHTLLDFTNSKEKIAAAVQTGFQPDFNGNACLNDAVSDAINNLSRAPGRRGLLIVTASVDGCGKSADQALTLAKKNHIQIYAVGMTGYKVASAQDLTYLTEPTGGLAYARQPNDLRFALLNVTQALRLQWSAKATLFPSAGPETATVQLALSDQTVINTQPVFFNVPKTYAPPAQIKLRGAILSTKQGIRFGLDFVSPRLINQLKLNVTSKVTGDSINQQTLSQTQDTYDIPINNLTVGTSYILQITALDKTGAQVSQAGSEFQYQPPQGSLKLSPVVTPTAQSQEFVVQATDQDLEGVVKHRAWLQADGQTDPINAVEVPLNVRVAVPITNLKTGIYQIVVQALDASNAVMATATSEKVKYTEPSSIDAVVAYLLAHKILIYLMGGVGCLAVAALMVVIVIIIPKPRAQPKAVELYVPDVKRRAAPVNLEASKSQPLPPRPVPRRAPPEPEARPRPVAPSVPAPPSVSAPSSAAAPSAVAGNSNRAAAPAGMPKACLSGYAPADLRVATTIAKASYTIGRRDGNDLVLAVDNKIGVSGRHATIKFVDGQFFIVDDKSTFGTFVNDLRLPAGATLPLEDGAVIGLGPKVKIQFRLNCP